MMNILSISLLLTSLFAAALWSPSPAHQDDHREVIVKEGHRTVVVEYDKEADGSTKVLISPHDAVPSDDSKHTTSNDKPADQGMFSGPKELVCDAYGKCKHRLANALGKTKDKVEETAHGVSDKAREIEEHAKEAVSEAKDKVSEKVSEKVTVGKAKDAVAHGIDKAKKVAGDVVKNLDVVDTSKNMGGDIESNVTGEVKETVENVREAGEKSLGEIFRKLKEVGNDVVWYMVARDKIDAVAGLIHMLGYSTAYGMCVWVTFISSYVLGRYLPKQQFGMVQSRIYPVYFRAMAYCVSASLLGHLGMSRKNEGLNSVVWFPGLSLLAALLMVLTNMILLEPKATKTMYERMKIEKEEGRGVAPPTREGVVEGGATAVRTGGATTAMRPSTNVVGDATVGTPTAVAVVERRDILRLNEKLKRLNTYSSALNVLTLVALTWHMAYMGRRLHATK